MKTNKTQTLKEKINLFYKEYPLHHIATLDIHYTINNKFGINVALLKRAFGTYEFTPLNIVDSSMTIFSSKISGRKNTLELISYCLKSVSNQYWFDFHKTHKKFHCSIINLFVATKKIFSIRQLSIKQRLYLSLQLTFYMNIIDSLDNINPRIKNYVSFCSAHPLESILTYFFKKKKIPTFTLQHGFYFIYNKDSIDNLYFENFPSDFLLCWSQYTKDEFLSYGIPPEKLIIGGYPNSEILPLKIDKLKKENCIVFLARIDNEKANLKLLPILNDFAKKTKVAITIKLHPTLNFNKYKKLCEINDFELMDQAVTSFDALNSANFGWAIAVNTTVYYESYVYGVPCLRFRDSSFDDGINVMQDDFYTSEDLANIYSNIPFPSLNNYMKTASSKIKYILGIGINNYSILN